MNIFVSDVNSTAAREHTNSSKSKFELLLRISRVYNGQDRAYLGSSKECLLVSLDNKFLDQYVFTAIPRHDGHSVPLSNSQRMKTPCNFIAFRVQIPVRPSNALPCRNQCLLVAIQSNLLLE